MIGTAPDGTPIDNAVLAQGDGAGVDFAAQDGTGSKVDLLQEEQNGGHTIADHVGKSDSFLIDRINNSKIDVG